MTPKERLAASLIEFAKQWEGGKTIYAISEETGCCNETIQMLFTAHFGKKRYDEIALEHRKTYCFSKGKKFQPGNTLNTLRKTAFVNDRLPIGSMSIWKMNGKMVRYIKVAHGDNSKGWKPVARAIWEKLHGPIPRGCIVTHIDGDSLNDDPSNIKMVQLCELGGVAKRIAAARARQLRAMQEEAA